MRDHGDIDAYRSRRSTVYGTGGVVATSQPVAAQAGIDTLRAGGNAFDAAITTAAVLNVVEPFNTGVGGDAFALYRTADGDFGGMRAMGSAPRNASLEEIRDTVAKEGANSLEMPSRGPLTVTAPGAPRGWEYLLKEYGRTDLATALEPAIDYAKNGFPVTEVIASQWQDNQNNLCNNHARETFLIDGTSPATGDLVRLPSLSRTFKRMSEQGADAIYQGEIGEKIIETVQSHGGFLSHKDLTEVEVEEVTPVSTTYNGAEIYELPAPNQGPIAIEALNIAHEADARGCASDLVESTHRYVESFKRAFHDGHQYLADPSIEDIPPIMNRDWARKRAETIDSGVTDVSAASFNPTSAEDADTVLVTAVDADGNVVSFINSIFAAFGSGIAADGTGILLQSRGGSFSLNSNHPNSFAPGKRPFHTLIPGLVQFDTNDLAAFGVMGGFMQPQGHLQILAGLLDKDDSLQESLDRPRWRYRSDGRLAVESRFDSQMLTKLVRRGHDVVVQTPDEFGGGQIARYNDGILSGATEPRKDGIAAGF